MKQIKPKITEDQTLEQLHDEIVARREWTYRMPDRLKNLWRGLSHWIRHLRHDPSIRMFDGGVKVNGVSVKIDKKARGKFPLNDGPFKDMRNVDYQLDVTTGLDDVLKK